MMITLKDGKQFSSQAWLLKSTLLVNLDCLKGESLVNFANGSSRTPAVTFGEFIGCRLSGLKLLEKEDFQLKDFIFRFV